MFIKISFHITQAPTTTHAGISIAMNVNICSVLYLVVVSLCPNMASIATEHF